VSNTTLKLCKEVDPTATTGEMEISKDTPETKALKKHSTFSGEPHLFEAMKAVGVTVFLDKPYGPI